MPLHLLHEFALIPSWRSSIIEYWLVNSWVI